MKPILFSTPMVQAIAGGDKTQTRRIMKPQPIPHATAIKLPIELDQYSRELKKLSKKGFGQVCTGGPLAGQISPRPLYSVGDILWVRETWCEGFSDGNKFHYKADDPEEFKRMGWKWKPSLFMPLEAARFFLEVTRVRIERVQDIEEEDIVAEGIQLTGLLNISDRNSAADFLPHGCFADGKKPTRQQLLFAHWAELWCSINGRESWDANPWVFVYDFKLTEKPQP